MEKLIIAYDQKLISFKYSGAKKRYGIPYLFAKEPFTIENNTTQKTRSKWFLFKLTKKS
jgi:hypothetical protein